MRNLPRLCMRGCRFLPRGGTARRKGKASALRLGEEKERPCLFVRRKEKNRLDSADVRGGEKTGTSFLPFRIGSDKEG